MKRLLIATFAVLFIGTAGFAQTKTTKPVNSVTQTKPVVKKEVAKTQMKQTSVSAKTSTKATGTTTTTTTNTATKTKLKKDGTPDKRFKENKTTVSTVTPKKKDGTPDMRYKANKKKNS